MTINQFIFLIWIVFACAAIWQVVMSWLLFSVFFKGAFERIYNFNRMVFIIIPVVVIVIVAHLYFFIPAVRPVVDGINHSILVGIDRVLYSSMHDSPTGKYNSDFVNMPIYPENYDLVIADEVCSEKVNHDDTFDDATLNEKCKGIPWTPKIRTTYLVLNADGDFKYSSEQARALYLGRPIPYDPIYDENEDGLVDE